MADESPRFVGLSMKPLEAWSCSGVMEDGSAGRGIPDFFSYGSEFLRCRRGRADPDGSISISIGSSGGMNVLSAEDHLCRPVRAEAEVVLSLCG